MPVAHHAMCLVLVAPRQLPLPPEVTRGAAPIVSRLPIVVPVA